MESGLICKGSLYIGTACMECEKCTDEVARISRKLVKDLTANEIECLIFIRNHDEKKRKERRFC